MNSTFIHLSAGDLTNREKYESLELLVLLKEKLDGSVKGQACADGRKQRTESSKKDATSPTVFIEAVLIIDGYYPFSITLVFW